MSSLAGLVVLALLSTGCLFYPAATRTIAATGSQPWWCQGTPALTDAECTLFSAQLDIVLAAAYAYPTVGDATAAGASPVTGGTDTGSAYSWPGAPSTFSPGQPQALLYEGTDATDRLVGVAHLITVGAGQPAPEGYPGDRDQWTEVDAATGTYMLPMWIIRGYLHHPDVFASGHPCLASGVTLTTTTDACFVAAHTVPLDLLVTNDDGIDAPGIDALVQGLLGVSGVTVTVVAPAVNQSGTGDTTTPGGVTSAPGATASGYPGQAVDGTPGDSVLHALNVLGETPDLVLSGINSGQNMGPIIPLSGTVGAARIAGRNGVPSIASSQGIGGGQPADFPAGVTATLELLERWRLGLAGEPFMTVPNINIPSCAPGSSVRGTIDTVVAASLDGRSYTAQDCTSTVTVINDDVDAFNHGFVGIADAGLS